MLPFDTVNRFLLLARIIVDLLKMNVAPQAVFQTLKAMCAGQRVAESCVESSHTTSMTTAPAEVKGQCLFDLGWTN